MGSGISISLSKEEKLDNGVSNNTTMVKKSGSTKSRWTMELLWRHIMLTARKKDSASLLMLMEELSKGLWKTTSAMELGNFTSLRVQYYLVTSARLTMLMESKVLESMIEEIFEGQMIGHVS